MFIPDLTGFASDMALTIEKVKHKERLNLVDLLHEQGKLSDDDYASVKFDLAMMYSDAIDHAIKMKSDIAEQLRKSNAIAGLVVNVNDPSLSISTRYLAAKALVETGGDEALIKPL